MAQTFGDPYDIEVPLRTKWTESIIFQDVNGTPIALPAKARGQLREVIDRDDNGNLIFGDSILDLTTEGSDANLVVPQPVDPAPPTGELRLTVPATDVGDLSPENLQLQVAYDIEFYTDDDDVQPAIGGTVTFTQRVTVPA